MTLIALQATSNLLVHLLNPAVRASVLAGAVGLGLAAFRVKAPAVRLFIWSGVLYAAIAMPLLGPLLPPLSIPTPAFVQFAVSHYLTAGSIPEDVQGGSELFAAKPIPSKVGEVRSAPFEAGKHMPSSEIIPQISSSSPASHPPQYQEVRIVTPAPQTSSSSSVLIRWASTRWNAVMTGIYLAVTSLLLVRLFVGLALARRLIQTSQRIDEPQIRQRLAHRPYASGLASVPQAAESDFISVPLTMGVLRSTILLPSSWREWDDAKLNAVLAHEVSHVARRDALTQRISLLHCVIFWFSPLAWWLDRQLADLAEQASDEAALVCGANNKDYARILLGFFEELQTASGRVWWRGVAMAKAGQAERRVERILSWKGSVAMRLKKSIVLVIGALAVPLVYLAASARPAIYAAAPQHPYAAKGATAQVTPASADTPSSQPSVAPMAAVSPRAIWSDQSKDSEGSSGHSSYHYGYDDGPRFVIASGQNDALTMSGTSEDARHVQKLKKSIQGDFIWFQRDEKSYVIRDQVTIDRARKFWAPQEELGKQQEVLGKQQEALGKQQEELGSKMEQVKVNVPDMTAELDKLKAELKQLNSGATMEQIGRIQSAIGELQSKIGDLQSQAGERQGELGRQQGELGEKQGKLGQQQGELGRQQGELAQKAARQMNELLDEAIAKGIAQPEL